MIQQRWCERRRATRLSSAASSSFSPSRLARWWWCLLVVRLSSFAIARADDDDDERARRRPNLLYVIADQLRYDVLGVVQDATPRYAGHLRVSTPNLDRLAARGVRFASAYCQCPVCAPARGTLRTGTTLERSGLQSNRLPKRDVYESREVFRRKMNDVVTLDQILLEEGYANEYYGKWHLPDRWYFSKDDPSVPAVRYNDLDPANEDDGWRLRPDEDWGVKYRRWLKYRTRLGELSDDLVPGSGDQIDTYSRFPYSPASLDARHGFPTGAGFSHGRGSQPDLIGNYTATALPDDATPTAYNVRVGLAALDRLAPASRGRDAPFALTVSLHAPHAPMIAASSFVARYWNDRDALFAPPSLKDDLRTSAYSNARFRSYGCDDESKVREWTAIYYGMVEEVDQQVGRLLDRLDAHGVANDTLVVFTSDHGEMLGAHGMREKNTFFEESARVPLLMAMPGALPENRVVEEDVSHLDLVATILDRMNLGARDETDGESLARFATNDENAVRVRNEHRDEGAIVVEWDHRSPTGQSNDDLNRRLGSETNFLVKKGPHKLMLTKLAAASRIDMMYDLDRDPYETNNLLRDPTNARDDAVIGKAEHLKRLLLEWMELHDGPGYYGGDPRYTDSTLGPFDDGIPTSRGDISEIRRRRTWEARWLWISDPTLSFDGPLARGVRYEYLYLGHTSDDDDDEGLVVRDVALRRDDDDASDGVVLRVAGYRLVDERGRAEDRTVDDASFPIRIPKNGHVRVRVALEAPTDDSGVRARVVVRYDDEDGTLRETVVPVVRRRRQTNADDGDSGHDHDGTNEGDNSGSDGDSGNDSDGSDGDSGNDNSDFANEIADSENTGLLLLAPGNSNDREKQIVDQKRHEDFANEISESLNGKIPLRESTTSPERRRRRQRTREERARERQQERRDDRRRQRRRRRRSQRRQT